MTDQQKAVLASFLSGNVEYAVVGGVAVNAYGYVRATQDLDLFIRPSVENAHAAFQALLHLGIPLDEGMEATDLLSDVDHLRFGPEESHVDILSSIGDMDFDRVWTNRVYATIGGLPIPFISKTDLMENKKQVGRLRDLTDVEELLLIPDVEPGHTR